MCTIKILDRMQGFECEFKRGCSCFLVTLKQHLSDVLFVCFFYFCSTFMNYKIILCAVGVLFFTACNSSESNYALSAYKNNFDGLMDTILPYLAKGHDTIPKSSRFEAQFKHYYDQQKVERNYQWMHYFEAKDSYSYFAIQRDEPSMKRDKFLAICGRFKRNNLGSVDTSTYEELFWTWKMKAEDLKPKVLELFSKVVKGESLDAYTPEKSKGEWIEFPGNGVSYHQKSKSWQIMP